MHKYLIAVFCFLTVLPGCKKLDELTKFDQEYNTEVTIPSTLPINVPLSIPVQDVETNTATTFQNNNTNADLVESIKLKSLKLVATSPPGQQFDFAKDIRVYISADGLPEVELANKLNIDDNEVAGELDLDIIDNELMEYLKQDKINFRVYTITDQLLVGNVQISVQSVFRVDAKILGI
jgi:hypothetical protein